MPGERGKKGAKYSLGTAQILGAGLRIRIRKTEKARTRTFKNPF